MSAIYIEAFSGLSGNMLLSALGQLAGDLTELQDLPKLLHLPEAKIEISSTNKNGIHCPYIEVIEIEEPEHQHNADAHHHHHHHGHEHHHHGRHLKDIQKIIDTAHISEGAKKIAHAIFLLIGKAESHIHQIPLEKIHFHEISAVDSIVDIVGNAVLIDKLQIETVICTPICTGSGMVKTQHGLLPVPAPATAELLQGMPTYPGDEAGEKITPTGAAILKYLAPSFESGTYRTKKIAYGPGKKDFQYPNVVRISLLEDETIKKKPIYN